MKDLAYFSELIDQIDILTSNYNKTIVGASNLVINSELGIAGMNLIEQMVLRYIYLYGPFSMSILSNLTNLKPSYLSKVSKNLLKMQMCEKVRSKEDHRVFNIRLTNSGHKLTKEHVEKLRKAFLYRFSIFDKEKIEQFRKKLIYIIEYLIVLMQKLGIWHEILIKDFYQYDLFELMDKRSKCTNKLLLYFGAEKKLPFFQENFNYYQNNIIFYLHAKGAMSISALSKLTGFDLKHLSRTLIGLLERGFLTKTSNPNDKRVRNVELSDLGISLANRQSLMEKECYMDYFSMFFDDNQLDSFLDAHKTLNRMYNSSLPSC